MLEAVKNHVFSLMIISLASGAAMLFIPGDENGIGKYIKYVISLIIIITLLIPFKDIIYMIPKVLSDEMSILTDSGIEIQNDVIYDEIIELSLSEIENSIREEIKKDHNVEVLGVYIETDNSNIENIVFTEIQIQFGGKTDSDKAEHICDTLEGEYFCTVKYEIVQSGGDE